MSVCNPFRAQQMHQSNVFKKIMAVMILLISCISVVDIFLKNYFFKKCSITVITNSEEMPKFHVNRYSFFSKIGFFFLPAAFVSSFFYLKISLVLLRSNKNVNRNRGLTLAFFVNTVFWVTAWCWAFYAEV